MALTKAALVQPQGLTTTERDLLVLAGADTGRLIYNETTNVLEQWSGSAWIPVLNINSQLNGANLTGSVQTSLLAGNVDGGVY